MLNDIVEARALEGFRLHIRFEDGVEGVVNIKEFVRFEGVFAALGERAVFEKVRVNEELGTVCWPNGADLDPDVLYSHVSGIPIPSFEAKPLRA
jgi:hypothetical protein